MKETGHSRWVSEFNKEINKLSSLRTNSGESSSRRLEEGIASTSTIANEVRGEDIPRGGDEDDAEDGYSSSPGLQKRASSQENDFVLEVVSIEDGISFSGMKYTTV